MDPNLELYKSILHLDLRERRQRMQHLPRSECIRVRKIVEREERARMLQEKLAGRDLVEMALSDPSEFRGSPLLQNALLGRALTVPDESAMVARVTGKSWSSGEGLLSSMASYDQGNEPYIPIDAWKLVYCDLYYIDGSNATLQDIYEERLREEELQTPAAQAREIVRRDVIKLARRNAKWMISGLEQLSDEERGQEIVQYKETLHTIWKRVSPAPPAWIQHILDAKEQWGFVYYRAREVDRKYGRDWATWWDRIMDSQLPSTERNMGDATVFSIHCQGNRSDLMYLATEDWPTFHANNNLAEDDDFRKQFKEYVQNKGDLLPAGISRSTFIVIPTDLIPDSAEWDEGNELDPYWVWAYDADWDSSEETVFEGETYQGRVKVAYYSLKSWFYGARWEGNFWDDIAGYIESVGPGVFEFQPGDRVAAFHEMFTPHGAFAEYAIAYAHTTFRIPQQISFQEAAAMPLTPMTAALWLYQYLDLPYPWITEEYHPERPPLVVFGIGAAVGSFVVQLARKSRIHPIICVAGQSKDHVETLIDCSKGDIVIDYRLGAEVVVTEIKKALGGKPLLHAFDSVADKGSDKILGAVLELHNARLAMVRPNNRTKICKTPGVNVEGLPMPTMEGVLEGVEAFWTAVGSVHGSDKHSGYVMFRYIALRLAEGWLKPHPHEVVPGGTDRSY